MTLYSTNFKAGDLMDVHPVSFEQQADDRFEPRDRDVRIDFSCIKTHFHIEIPEDEIALFYRHRKLWLKFIDSQASYCLIRQEDIQSTRPLSVIANSLKELPAGWEVYFPHSEKDARAGSSARFSLVHPQDFMLIMELYLNGSIYILTRSGAQKLLTISLTPASIPGRLQNPAIQKRIAVSNGFPNWLTPLPAVMKSRNEKIKKAIDNFNAWDQSHKTLARELLKIVGDEARRRHFDLILHGGTLLGYVRHGGIMPWDDDIDLGIEGREEDRFIEELGRLPGIRIASFVEARSGIRYHKLWLKDGATIANRDFLFPFIDLWIYDADGKDIRFRNGFLFRNALEKPLNEVSFEGAQLRIPHNPLECLDSMYKDWRHSIRIYPFSHRLETIANFPLSMVITTDINGKITQ
jgi:hypothetical protein